MKNEPEEDVFSERLDLKLWSQILRRALPYRKLLVILLFTAVSVALIEASFALVTRWAVDDVVAASGELAGELAIGAQVATYAGLAVGLSVGILIFIIAAGGLAHRMSHDIRRESFQRIQELEFAYFDHRPTGWLISRLTSDCDKLSRIIAWGSMDLVWSFCLISIISVILLVLHPVLGLFVLSVLPVLVMVSAHFQKKLLLSSRDTRKFNSKITAAFAEALQGLRTSKALVREEANLHEFQGLSTQMYQSSRQNAFQSAIYIPIVLTIGSVAAGIALWRGGAAVRSEALSLGTLVAFIFYAGQFFNPINQIAQVLVQMQGAQAAGERVLSLLDTRPRIADSEAVLERMERHQAKGGDFAERAPDGGGLDFESLEFRGVGFSYDQGETVLDDFNLTVSAGETIALVGASGGGKSTIVNLAARFYEPTAGGVLLNGEDLRERSLEWYQSNLGVVL